jgi:uncharacterized protein with beta-barrel porin domain
MTAGLDYRFIKNFIAGIAFGYNNSRANTDSAGSKVKMDGYTFGTYGTYYNGDFYLDGSVSYGISDYDNTRRIVFPVSTAPQHPPRRGTRSPHTEEPDTGSQRRTGE